MNLENATIEEIKNEDGTTGAGNQPNKKCLNLLDADLERIENDPAYRVDMCKNYKLEFGICNEKDDKNHTINECKFEYERFIKSNEECTSEEKRYEVKICKNKNRFNKIQVNNQESGSPTESPKTSNPPTGSEEPTQCKEDEFLDEYVKCVNIYEGSGDLGECIDGKQYAKTSSNTFKCKDVLAIPYSKKSEEICKFVDNPYIEGFANTTEEPTEVLTDNNDYISWKYKNDVLYCREEKYIGGDSNFIFIDYDIEASTTYKYRIYAMNNKKEEWSNESNVLLIQTRTLNPIYRLSTKHQPININNQVKYIDNNLSFNDIKKGIPLKNLKEYLEEYNNDEKNGVIDSVDSGKE